MWKGNYLVVVYDNKNLGCTKLYVRYYDNKVEILSIEPKLTCWEEGSREANYTLRFNNIISATKAYLLSRDMLIYTRCSFFKKSKTNLCVFNGNTPTNYEQVKNYGFVELRNYDKIELKNFQK